MSEVTYNIIYDKVGMIVWLLRKDKRKLKNNTVLIKIKYYLYGERLQFISFIYICSTNQV